MSIFSLLSSIFSLNSRSTQENDLVAKQLYDEAEEYNKCRDYNRALQCYEKAADKGSVDAMMRLGYLYSRDSSEPDYEKAMQWYKKAINKGNTDAMVETGQLYLHGRGCKKDFQRGLSWYKKAVNKGNADAMFEIAVLNYSANAVQQGDAWLKKAADKGGSKMMRKIGTLYLSGYVVKQDSQKSEFWFKKARELEAEQ